MMAISNVGLHTALGRYTGHQVPAVKSFNTGHATQQSQFTGDQVHFGLAILGRKKPAPPKSLHESLWGLEIKGREDANKFIAEAVRLSNTSIATSENKQEQRHYEEYRASLAAKVAEDVTNGPAKEALLKVLEPQPTREDKEQVPNHLGHFSSPQVATGFLVRFLKQLTPKEHPIAQQTVKAAFPKTREQQEDKGYVAITTDPHFRHPLRAFAEQVLRQLKSRC